MSDKTPADPKDGDPIITPNPGEKGESIEITFTPEQQKLIDKRIGEARRDGRKAAEDAAAEAKRKAEADADVARQIAAGEFDTARQAIEAERDKAIADRDAANAKLEAVVSSLETSVKEAWKTLPPEIAELYDGAADDIVAMQAHISKHAKLLERLTGQQEQARKVAGFGQTPQPNGGGAPERKAVGTIKF